MASLETIIPMMEMNPVDVASGEKKQKEKKDADSRYFYDPEKLKEIKQQKPWMKEPKYFEKVAVSPSALIKIVRQVGRISTGYGWSHWRHFESHFKFSHSHRFLLATASCR